MNSILKIKKKLADYCVYQDRSHWEVEKKIKEASYLNEEEKGEIIIWLIQNNFLNEERFAKAYVKGKFNQKQWGRNKIIIGLKQKRVPEKLIDIALNEIDEEAYQATLEIVADKKWNSLIENTAISKKKKLISFLIQKGYENQLIYDLIKIKYSD
ncbi:regulatory protein RecX [Apibacter adventoris]|uniref:Regulatory protein RecX n=1 Tax=Apibacter adventoris TaxID=1679466 RepID=A0A2S8A7P9_9FLAO|nr:regulatory protein RecX [Apibacter adventoris]PQL90597.1 recombinase RecX [Apibacter adventoris]